MAGSKAITPGCMVMIIGSRQPDSPNVGKMGTAVRLAVHDDVFNNIRFSNPNNETCWVVEGPGLKCFVANRVTGDRWDSDDMCLSREHQLLRIDPEADPLDVTHEEPIGALS